MRTVCVFTSTRADFGLLRPIAERLREDPAIRLQVLASGSHLSEAFGRTIDEVRAAGFAVDAEVPIVQDDDGPRGVCQAMGLAMAGYGEALLNLKPDLLVVLGDRYETLCVAAAAQVCRVPIAHVHGGETSQGAVDEAFRHAITKMSHLHLTSCETHRQRVIQLGEPPATVFDVGAVGVENARQVKRMSRAELAEAFGIPQDKPLLLVTFHPSTLEDASAEQQCADMLAALDTFAEHHVVLTKANADAEGQTINRVLEAHVADKPNRYQLFDSLGMRGFLSALSVCDAMVGNSSSGILEAPAFRVPTVNIGDRQKGRVRAASVIDCKPTTEAIIQAIEQALSPGFRASLEGMTHPCEKPSTAAEIARLIRDTPLDGVMTKPFFDLPHTADSRNTPR